MELAQSYQATILEPAKHLDDVVSHVQSISRDFRDHSGILLGNTRVEEDGAWRYNGEAGRLSRHALSQLCARLELPSGGTVPASYLARCPAPLVAENLNHWLADPKREGQKVFVRTNHWEPDVPRVRAVLSDRYAIVDHLPLLETLGQLLPQHQLQVQSWSLDDEQLIVRLNVPGDHPASLEDPLRVGLHLSNSEVGLGRITITALITRLVCTNGLVVKVADLGGVHRKHVGRAGESLREVVQAAIPRVLAEADEAAVRFVRLRQVPAPQPLDAFIERTAKEAELSEANTQRARGLLEGETLFDVVNAFTRLAQAFPVAERVRIETQMSRFLQSGASWN